MIPYGRQDITQEDIDAVVSVLRSDFLTQGPQVPLFENSIANYCGVEYALAVNSATSGLHLACMALDLGPGDWLWTTPITFVASANCALYCGAQVDFVDIDPNTYNLSVSRLAEKLELAEANGCLPKVVVAVHLAGQPCDMAGIYALSIKYGFRIVEDASHAVGATYRNEPVGNCRYSDITVFSFHPVKIITTAEGGLITTNNIEIARRLMLLRSHGITRDPAEMAHSPEGSWYYEQIDLGYNYRMTDLQAALGLSQMQRLNQYILRRREIARWYDEQLAELPLTCPWQHPDTNSAYHLYVVRLKLDFLQLSHKDIFEGMRNRGIGVNLHYIPIPRHPYYAKLGHRITDLPEAEKYYAEAISLPMFPTLTSSQLEKTVRVLREVLCL